MVFLSETGWRACILAILALGGHGRDAGRVGLDAEGRHDWFGFWVGLNGARRGDRVMLDLCIRVLLDFFEMHSLKLLGSTGNLL